MDESNLLDALKILAVMGLWAIILLLIGLLLEFVSGLRGRGAGG